MNPIAIEQSRHKWTEGSQHLLIHLMHQIWMPSFPCIDGLSERGATRGNKAKGIPASYVFTTVNIQ
jgi:hypothetical protein